MSTFIALSVELHFLSALALIPVAAIGHVLGLKAHDVMARNDVLFKRGLGAGLVAVSTLGLMKLDLAKHAYQALAMLKGSVDWQMLIH